jgi:hypothetical protein
MERPYLEQMMNSRCLCFVGGLTALVALAQGQVASPYAAAKVNAGKPSWTAPRNADGHPDLSGSWANNNATPLERPLELNGRPYLTEQEVAALKKKAGELFNGQGDAAFGDTVFNTVLANVKGTKSGFKSTDGETGDYSSVWTVQRDWDNRTSLITDPPDGRQPAMTAEGLKRKEANFGGGLNRPANEPADRPLQERCITYGSPSLVAGYQSGYQIAQTSNSVVVMTEMIHDARVIPLDGRPHGPSSVRQWMGDSRGHWEGDTLVVDTINYKPRSFMSVSSEKLHVTERFTRTAPDLIQYEIKIDDPGTWTKPWSLMIPLRRSSDPMYEYACHEGNIGMAGILAGARAADKAAAGNQSK